MTPITPVLDTPAGRLAELVHLVSDESFHDALAVINTTIDHPVEEDDPWWIVATVLVELRRRREEAEWFAVPVPA